MLLIFIFPILMYLFCLFSNTTKEEIQRKYIEREIEKINEKIYKFGCGHGGPQINNILSNKEYEILLNYRNLTKIEH